MEITQHEEVLLAQSLIDEVTNTLKMLRGKLAASNLNHVSIKDSVVLCRAQVARIELHVGQIAMV